MPNTPLTTTTGAVELTPEERAALESSIADYERGGRDHDIIMASLLRRLLAHAAGRLAPRHLYEINGATYRVVAEPWRIVCKTCGLISFSISDIANLYCGRCQVFHEER